MRGLDDVTTASLFFKSIKYNWKTEPTIEKAAAVFYLSGQYKKYFEIDDTDKSLEKTVPKEYWDREEDKFRLRKYFNLNEKKHRKEDKRKSKGFIPDPNRTTHENYLLYLRSHFWRIIKNKVKKKANNQCELCSSKFKLQVHHKTYKRLYYERLEDLMLLCETCHQKQHPGWNQELDKKMMKILIFRKYSYICTS